MLGIAINDSGKLVTTTKTFTIDQALSKVNSLKDKLTQRNTHVEVFKYCTKELVANNYFHAVFESCKGVACRLRDFTGLNKDGAELVDMIFSLSNPIVKINGLISESEKSEHKGFANLLKGIFGMIRNPLAHDPKLNWNMNEQDALDIFAMLSMIHRKIDIMVLIPKN
ncbi:MAG: TIGR02391 family protein [Burkholderiales bacterium]|nr:TIGR02391 family protein [Burkholderiales bacterium]